MIIQLTLIFVVLVIVHVLSRREYLHLPSPKMYVPWIGHIEMMMNSHDPVGNMKSLYNKYSKHGMMFTSIFGLNNLFIGDYETVKFLLNHPQVQNRGHAQYSKNLLHQKLVVDKGWDASQPSRGVIFSQGRTWVEQRRITLKTLRDFGFGKLSMEETIQDEVKKFLNFLRSTSQEPIDLGSKFNLPVLNVLWRVTVGQSYEYDDPKLKAIIDLIHEFIVVVANPSAVFHITFPFLFKVFPNAFGRQIPVEMNKKINDLLDSCLEEHMETLDEEHPRDYIDTILIEIKKNEDPNSSFYKEVGKQNLINTLNDLFLAGSETSSTTLTWAMLYMIRYPEKQKRVQDELDSVVGRGRLPSLTDRPNLPYTEAVLMETQRCGNIVPMGVQHCNAVPIEVNGITIPANTWISPLMTCLLKGEYWGDGDSFRPERFLDENGKVKMDEHWMPFAVGKRRCLGETLAKTEFFSFFACIVHEFNVLPEDPNNLPTEDYAMGATILPKPFKVVFQPRQ